MNSEMYYVHSLKTTIIGETENLAIKLDSGDNPDFVESSSV